METVAELQAAHPDLVAEIASQAAASAAAAERERIRAIDEIAGRIAPGLVAKAKYEEPMTAEQLALAAINAQMAQGSAFASAAEADAAESCAESVAAEPNGGAEDDEEQDAAEAAALIEVAAAYVNKAYGRS